jgi:hypothetical protein
MEQEPLLHRDELTGTLFMLADMSANIERIRELLEEELGGQEGLEEDAS